MGFAKLPERLRQDAHASTQVGGVHIEAVVVKAFTSVRPQSVPVFVGMSYNPQRHFSDSFGRRIADLQSADKDVKHEYSPETILQALRQLWLNGNVENQSEQASEKIKPCLTRKNFGKRKRSEAKQLNEDLLMRELKLTGFSCKQARQVINHDSKGWEMHIDPGSEAGPELTLKVFRPGQSEPVITAKFEKAHAQIAALWRQEFLLPESKAPANIARYTRQQEKADAAAAKQNEQQGLNAVQQKQMQDMLAAALQPITETQQWQQSKVEKLQQDQNDLTVLARQQVTLLQRLSPALDRLSQLPSIGWPNVPVAGPSAGPVAAPLHTMHDSCEGSQAS